MKIDQPNKKKREQQDSHQKKGHVGECDEIKKSMGKTLFSLFMFLSSLYFISTCTLTDLTFYILVIFLIFKTN